MVKRPSPSFFTKDVATVYAFFTIALSSVRLVTRIALSHVAEHAHEIVAQLQRVRLATVEVGDDLQRGPAIREVRHVHGYRLLGSCLKSCIESEISHHEIDFAVARKIAGDDPIPPAVAVLETPRNEPGQLAMTCVVKDGDRHPLAYNDKVRSPIAVYILPHCIGHHAYMRQAGSRRFRYVGKVSVAVVV